jgi:hypothetical protein
VTQTPETVTLWTLQPICVWEALQAEGVLRVDDQHPRFEDGFRTPYDWLRRQMAARTHGYQGGYPWWAWHSPKPDLRSERHGIGMGQEYVRMELRVDKSRVMLSDFDMWHCVLNGCYLALDEQEDADFDAAWDRRLCSKHWRVKSENWPPAMWDEFRAQVAESWVRCLDEEQFSQSSEWWGVQRSIQATFEEFRLSDVVRVTHYVGARTAIQRMIKETQEGLDGAMAG